MGCERGCLYPSECRWGKKVVVGTGTTGEIGEKMYEAYSSATTTVQEVGGKVAVMKGQDRSELFLRRLVMAAERKSAALDGVRTALSPVEEEEEARSPVSEDLLGSLVDLRSLDTLTTVESGVFRMSREEEDVVMRDGDVSTGDGGLGQGVTLYDASYELSPTSPGRRNAWDWSVDVTDGEKDGFWDVEMV